MVKPLKVRLKKILYKYFQFYKGKYLGIHLQGGLCNKLLCLISASDIAIKEECRLIEPYFGWKKRILFSDIYDLDYFNSKIFEFTGVRNLIISRKKYLSLQDKQQSIENVISLWEYSEKNLEGLRANCAVSQENTLLKVLKALKLRPELEKIMNKFSKGSTYTAVQIRTESDWKRYTKDFNGKDKERIYIPAEEIIDMLEDFEISGNLFFTTGEDQEHTQNLFKAKGFKADFYYDPAKEYEINAAINFEICCRAKKFIGLSRSSFSNLISLKRAVIFNNDQSFIYNYDHKILRRLDKGLQYKAALSISEKTVILN